MQLYILVENVEIKINGIDVEFLSYERKYINAIEPQVGGKLFLIRKNESNLHHFLYAHPDKGYEWVRVYGYGDNLGEGLIVNARIHSSCFFSEQLNSVECDCKAQLDGAHKILSDEARDQNIPGLLIYLQQEGRGHGLFNKLRIYEKMGIIDPDLGQGIRSRTKLRSLKMDTYEACKMLDLADDVREYSAALAVLEYFKAREVHLLTDNPWKLTAAVSKGNININIVQKAFVVTPPSLGAENYLKRKQRYFNSYKNSL